MGITNYGRRSLIAGIVVGMLVGGLAAPVTAQYPAPIQQAINQITNGIITFVTLGMNAGSYINWGTARQSSGYGLRDSSGTMQVKNSGGSWANIGYAGGAGSFSSVTSTTWFRGGTTADCSAPTFATTADTDTGITGITANQVAVCAGGTQVATFGVPSGAASDSNFFKVLGTLPSTLAANTNGVLFDIITAGSSASLIRALSVSLKPGYTGSSGTSGITVSNLTAGTGTGGWTGGSANVGVLANATPTTAGHNVGLSSRESNSSTLNLGGNFGAVSGNNSAALNVGMAAFALNAGVNVPGFFGLMSTAPTLAATAALIADNGAVAADIFQLRDNGTVVFSSVDGGDLAPASGIAYRVATKAFINTAPTVSSGFGTMPAIAASNGTAAFTIDVGTGGTASSGVIGLPTATTGWIVTCTDLTTPGVNVTKQTAVSTASATITNYNSTTGIAAAWTASDILYCQATAF